jgi:hypothetical protein
MAFNTNFTRVTLGDDSGGTLIVGGQSEPPETGVIHVAMPHDGKLLSGSVDAAGRLTWEVTLSGVTPAVAHGDEVFVVGVAMRSGSCDPLVWQGSFQIKRRTDV